MRRPVKPKKHADAVRAYQRIEADRARFVEERLGDKVICGACGATLKSFAGTCTSSLDKRCEGFDAIDQAKLAARAREQN